MFFLLNFDFWKKIIIAVIVILLVVGGLLVGYNLYTSNPMENSDSITPEITTEKFVNIIKYDGEAKLSNSDLQTLEEIGDGAEVPFFEDPGLKDAASSFRKLAQVKPVQSWQVTEKTDDKATAEIEFYREGSEENKSVAKIYLSKNAKFFGLNQNWKIYQVDTPEDLGPCFAVLTRPEEKVLACLWQRIQEIPGLLWKLRALAEALFGRFETGLF
jgi:hypothetical protein